MSKEYPSTLFIFRPGRSYDQIPFGDELPEGVAAEVWKQTDAWRGYTDWSLEPGYIEIADGWTTGYPDESVPQKKELADMFEELRTGELVPPCDIYWLFGITSNVFSQASKIYIKEKDRPVLKAWLDEINGGLEELQEKMA